MHFCVCSFSRAHSYAIDCGFLFRAKRIKTLAFRQIWRDGCLSHPTKYWGASCGAKGDGGRNITLAIDSSISFLRCATHGTLPTSVADSNTPRFKVFIRIFCEKIQRPKQRCKFLKHTLLRYFKQNCRAKEKESGLEWLDRLFNWRYGRHLFIVLFIPRRYDRRAIKTHIAAYSWETAVPFEFKTSRVTMTSWSILHETGSVILNGNGRNECRGMPRLNCIFN